MNYTIFTYPFEHKVQFDKDEGMNRNDTVRFLRENCNKIYCLFQEHKSDNITYFDMGTEHDSLAYNVSSTIREIIIPNIGNIMDNLVDEQLLHILIDSHDETPDLFDHIIIVKLGDNDRYLLQKYVAVKDKEFDYRQIVYMYSHEKQSSKDSTDSTSSTDSTDSTDSTCTVCTSSTSSTSSKKEHPPDCVIC